MTNESARQVTLLGALENERRHVAKELHDGVAQTALQLGLQTKICQKLLERNDLETLAGELTQLEERVNLAAHQVRALIQDLRPPTFKTEQPDLQDFIQYAVELHEQRGGGVISYQYKIEDGPLQLSANQMLGVMRIVQEALLHIRRSSEVQQVWLTLSTNANALYVTLVDDGTHFYSMGRPGHPDERHTGDISNLLARTEAVGGSLTVEHNPEGSETRLTVVVPL
jgi:two-component system sensor histidine kinase DegS